MRVVGVDGCRIGWICVEITASDYWSVQTYSSISRAWEAWNVRGGLDLALIDIPIGLRDSGPEPRLCEPVARKCLGKKHSSVFTPPVRSSLSLDSYEAASKNNFGKSGRKLSKQAWGIVPKIAEVDAFLESEFAARGVLRESHPEVLFCKLNDDQPMTHRKNKPNGFRERLDLASKYFDAASDVVADARKRYPKKSEVADDDVLDALIAAIAASRCLQRGVFATMPDAPETDSRGLPMEMVFAV